MDFNTIVNHPVFIGFWSAFGVDFWHWISSPTWDFTTFDWNTATKRWAVGIVMGILAWQGLNRLLPASLVLFGG